MKHLKLLFFATIFSLSTWSMVQAQSKVAHIDTQKLIEAMPEMKAAESEMNKLSDTYKAEMQSSVNEWQTKAKQYQAEANTKTEEENINRAEEIETMRQSIAEYQQQAQVDLEKKRFDLLKPITEKAKTAIQTVASKLGYDYVLDATNGGGVLVANGKDLLEAVKRELGI